MTTTPDAADQYFPLGNVKLSLGGHLNSAQLCYVTLGSLNAEADNAILILHGYTSSHRFVVQGDPDSAEGSWADLVGPGKAIDTDRYFVVSPNALGSSYGSTGPGSDNPLTNTPYGPDFPAIQFEDMVTAQHQLLDHLGVKHIKAVIGLSMGGFEAFQWAVQYPDDMDQVIPVLTAPWGNINAQASQSVLDFLQNDPNWRGGWIYDESSLMLATMTKIRINTLKRYGVPAWLATQHNDAASVDQALDQMAKQWAMRFDPNAMICLRHAINRFDVRSRLHLVKAQVLYVLASTDQLFPPSIAKLTLEPLQEAKRSPVYAEISSEYGHLASSLDWQQWSEPLAAFLRAK
jgi:homoserine O-acetyltransferase